MKTKGILSLLFFILLLYTTSAQEMRNSKFRYRHSIDLGVSYANYYGQFVFDKQLTIWLPYLLKPGAAGRRWWILKFPDFKYKYYINDRFCLLLENQGFFGFGKHPFPSLGAQSIQFSTIGFGVGYKLQLSKLEIVPYIYFPYRYKGTEYVLADYGAGWPFEADAQFVDYDHTIGLGLGIELNYFFSSHFGFGLNFKYNNFLFDKAGLSDVTSINPAVRLSYQPVRSVFFLNPKLVYRFNLKRKEN